MVPSEYWTNFFHEQFRQTKNICKISGAHTFEDCGQTKPIPRQNWLKQWSNLCIEKIEMNAREQCKSYKHGTWTVVPSISFSSSRETDPTPTKPLYPDSGDQAEAALGQYNQCSSIGPGRHLGGAQHHPISAGNCSGETKGVLQNLSALGLTNV